MFQGQPENISVYSCLSTTRVIKNKNSCADLIVFLLSILLFLDLNRVFNCKIWSIMIEFASPKTSSKIEHHRVASFVS